MAPTPLAAHVSVFQGSTHTTPVETVSLANVLQRIHEGVYQQHVEQLRHILTTQGKAAYDKAKRHSVAFTPAGVFSQRANAKLTTPSGLLNYDFDHLPHLADAKARLKDTPSIVYVFDSPSGTGLKCAVWADGIVDDVTYKHAWSTVLAYLEQIYPDLVIANDKACKDIARLCYVSWDPDLYVNPDAQLYPVPRSPLPTPQSQPATQRSRAWGGTLSDEQGRVEAALRCIPADDRTTWLTIGMALHASGEPWARAIWDTWSQTSAKYDARDQDRVWQSLKADGGVTLGTLFHEAEQYGYIPATHSVKGTPHHAGPVPASNGTPPAAPSAHSQAETPEPPGPADMLLGRLKATSKHERLTLLTGAMDELGKLDPLDWMILKPKLKAQISDLNMNDLERAWTLRHKKHQALLSATEGQDGEPPGQDQIARDLATQWRSTTAYAVDAKEWFFYDAGLWSSIPGDFIEQRISTYMDTVAPGYTWYTLHGVERLLHARLATQLSLDTPGWLPFRNGALALATMTLHAHTPGRPFLYQLPYAFDPHATCPLTQAWLHESVGNDHGQVQLLRAFMKAVLTRRVDQQRYLENIGQGGTGKGTFMRLLTALIGRENVFITELKYLESNRFETSGLRHKLLMLVTDAERYSGPVNQLKAITGQDEVRMEEKYKKGSKDFAPVMVCISANEPIQSADYTSGLTRRRIAMAFRHKPAHPRDLLAWKDGQWVGELAAEIPGVLHWAMAMLDADVTTVLSDTETAVPTLHGLAKKAIIETNPLADWANGHLVLDETKDEDGRLVARVNVGVAKKAEHSDRYEYEEIWLYPHYRAWVESTGNKAVAMRRFASTLEDLLVNQLGLAVEHRSDKSGSHFKGIRLRTANMKAEPLFYSAE